MKRHILFVYVLFAILSIGASSYSPGDYCFLPKQVKPTEYDLWINTRVKHDSYTGIVIITVNVTKATPSITLHSRDLKIEYAFIDHDEALVQKDIKCDFLILKKSKSEIGKGMYNVTIKFDGNSMNKTFGFFEGHDHKNGRKQIFTTTFFQPINARTAFPCFDEPQLKAKFTISIVKPLNKHAREVFSNMDVIGESKSRNNVQTVHFRKSPPMSTYLVMFYAGPAYYVENFLDMRKDGKGKKITMRVYTTSDSDLKRRDVEFAATELPKIANWFQKYTGIKWMMPKLDYIALPDEFHIEGGMENWGAVTTRESSIFYNTSMSLLDSRRVKNLAHEIAHHWFGDLVTTGSWGEIWLNEGFARFMDIKIDDLYPQFKEHISSYSMVLHKALWRDDDLTTLPLVRKIKKRKDVYEILNLINYEKGGAILQMTENVIGKDVMQKVLHAYLTRFMYKSVTSQDFIDVLQDYVDFNCTDFLDGFLRQPGYPQITAQLENNGKKVILTRRRFLRYGLKDRKPKVWTVPISYITNVNKEPTFIWFPSNKTKITLKFPKKIKWIKLNHKQGAYYRSQYCYKTWKEQIKVMKDFAVEDRINILDDAIATVRSGSLPCNLAMDATTYLNEEDRIEVWETASSFFRTLRSGFLQHNKDIKSLKAYVVKLIDKQYKNYSWDVEDNETYSYKFNRFTIFNLACKYGHEDCLKEVKNRWETIEDEHVDIQRILKANNPNANRIQPYKESLNDMELQSSWFGADLTKLTLERPFKWPLKPISDCAKWLKKQMKK